MPSTDSRISALEEKTRRLEEERDAALAQVRKSQESQSEKTAKLRQSRQRISEAERLSHTGAWEWDVAADQWTFSDEWLSIHGRIERTLVPENLLEIAHPDDRAVIKRAFQNVRDGLAPYHLEHRIVRPDGSVRHIRAYGQYVRDAAGKVIRVYGFAQDITGQKRAEEELRWTHALIAGIAAGTEDLIAAQDGEFRYLFFNDAYKRKFKDLWGCDIEIGTRMLEALAPWPKELRKAQDLWGRALAGESFRTRTEFGSERERRIYDWQFYPVKDALGRQLGAAHILRDVTDQVRMQQAMAESEEQARRIIDNTVALVGVMTPDGTLTEANEIALRAGGLRREDVVGKKFWDCYWWSYDVQVQQQLRDAVAKAAGGEIVRYDVVVRTGNDGRMPIDFMLAPARNNAGQITHLIPSALDISERKRAEERLRQSEEELRRMVQSSPFPAILHAEDGEIVLVNAAWTRLSGYAHRDIPTIGAWTERAYRERREPIKSYIETLYELNAMVPEGEYTVVTASGEERIWDFFSGPAGRDQQDRRLVFSTASDVTERKRAEKALEEAKAAAEEANRAKSEFLASMSHEIRTPMTVFMSAIEHLLQTERNPDRRHLLSMADASAHRLRNLIDDILDFSRIEAQKVKIEEEPFDLRRCVQEAVTMFSLQAQEKNLMLDLRMAEDVPEIIIGDQNRVGQVLINLISNAVKFTQEGEVWISIQPRDKLLEFSVADTGIGIPKEKQHLLFKSFSQVDMSFHRQHGGSGLGLAICKGLVELMGGEISVQSRVGKGSVFTFNLPLKAAIKFEPEPYQEIMDESHKPFVNIRLLLVDDEPMIREMITMMLETRGLKVETAENGSDALQKWEAGDFDLILMDLQMPGMDGMEATRSIRAKEGEATKRTTIIGLTAHVRREIKEECLASGMDRVLVKPIKMPDLFSAIDDCFSH